jgi:RNA polymerase sigma factor (sigma-70 family)
MTAALPGRGIVTDAELVCAAAAGNRAAFAAIYDRYANPLHDFCIGMLRNREAAADCVQDAFCIAANSLPKLREPDKLRPWLYSIARYEALRYLRGRKREHVVDEVPEESDRGPGPTTLVRRNELAELIAAAAGGLSDRDQAVYELAYRQGLEGAELAEALGVSASNAKKMVQRLRETVERSLGALLVSRAVRNKAHFCQGLAEILDGWDGKKFTVLMRKRISRHIESCSVCDDLRRQVVSPVALLGAAPVVIAAPAALRQRTLDRIELVSPASSGPPPQHTGSGATRVQDAIGDEPTDVYSTIGTQANAAARSESGRGRFAKRAMAGAALVAGLIAVPAVAIAMQHNRDTTVNPANVTRSPTSPSAIDRRITPSTTLPAFSIIAPPTESSLAPRRVVVQDPTTNYEAPATVTAPPSAPADTSTSVGPTVRTSKVFTPPPVQTPTAPEQTMSLVPTAPSQQSQPTAPTQPSGGSTGAPSPGGRNIRTPVESLEPVVPTFGDGTIG